MSRFKRVQRELEKCCIEPDILGITIKAKDGSLADLIGTIPGPTGTPYEGGVFEIDMNLLGDYPFKPPQMRFITRIWHPNINSQNGVMSLDTLNKEWNPTLTLKEVLLSVQELLSAPQPDVPQDAVVANQYMEDYEAFVASARLWTATFAVKPSNPTGREKAEKLSELGFPRASVEKAMESNDINEVILAFEELVSFFSKRSN